MKSRGFKIYILLALAGFIIFGAVVFFTKNRESAKPEQDQLDISEDPAPKGIAATPEDVAALPRDTSALGGYNVLIADRGNNRLLEVTPDKKIVWEYNFDLPEAGLGADDIFFTDGGKTIVANLEEYQTIETIDYQTKKVTWSYGHPDKSGSKEGYLNTPDDAYKLPNGDFIVADIKNCRVIEISPDKKIVRQYGQAGHCGNGNGYLNKPNGDTPLDNGHILISNIVGHNLIELNEKWQPIFSMNIPLGYPSDPQPMQSGNILLANYLNPGKLIEISKKGEVVWQYDGGPKLKLNKPSLAIELPNGNILSNDDFNHRIIVIDKKTKEIIWQYGVSGKPGKELGQLNTPDGLDIIKRDSAPASAAILRNIGQVTHQAKDFVNQKVKVQGYLLKKENGYLIFSDETSGSVTGFDLPVSGQGIENIQFKQKYTLEGTLLDHGLDSSNHNLYHLELSAPPQ